MNKQRRKEIEKICERLEDLYSDLEYVMDEEQSAFDNLPESLQYTEKGEQMEENVSTIENSLDSIREAIDNLEDLL